MFLQKLPILAMIFLAGCSSICPQQQRLIPRSVLLALPERCFVSLDHSGHAISFVSRSKTEAKTCYLCVADTSGKITHKFPIQFSRDLDQYKWAYTHRHLLILQDTDGDENNHIICVNLEDSTLRDLTPFKNRKASIIKLSKKHPEEILISLNKDDVTWNDLYKLNIKTGTISLVFRNREYANFCCSDAPSIICDDDFNVRMVRKPLANGDVEYYKIENGKLKLFEKIGFEDTKTTEFLAISGDGKTIYRRESIGRDKVALVAQNINNKQKRILFEHPAVDVGDLESIVFDENGDPLLLHFEHLKTQLIALQKKAEHVIPTLKKFAQNNVAHLGSIANDKAIVALLSDTKSTKYFLYDLKTDQLRFLFAASPELDHYTFSPMEPFVIKSRDGLDLVCYLTKASDWKKDTPSPLIIMPHGGPWYRDSWRFDRRVQLLANRGYSVLQVNYRGSTGFGKHFTNIANNHLEEMHNDLLDAVDWAVKNKIAPRDKIAICGWSYGGYAALRGLTHSPGVFCCVVDFVGPSNWRTLLKTFPSYWTPDIASWHNWMGNPNTAEGIAYLYENSPISKIHNINKPIMVLQGARDPRVNKEESDQMVMALKKSQIPVTYVVYPDEGHGFLKKINDFSSMAFVEKFLARHLGGQYEPLRPEELQNSSHKIIEDAVGLLEELTH